MDSPSVVLVLGASGFIGGHATNRLTRPGIKVLGTSITGEHTDLICDLEDPGSVEATLEQARPEAILAVAGRSSVGGAWTDPAATYRTNTGGTFNLLEGMRRITPEAHLTLISSAAVYGAPRGEDDLPFTESDPLRPASPYAASKAAAEMVARQYELEHGLTIAVARLFNQIGPGQSAAQAPAEFAREIVMAKNRGDRELKLAVGNPGAGRDYTDVRDTCLALAAIVEGRLTGSFNVCSGNAVTISEIAEGLGSHSPVEVGIELTPERAHPADVARVTGSADRLREETGWRPEIPLWLSLLDLLDDWRHRV